MSEQGKEEAPLTSYSNPANPLEMSGLDQARQEMRDQVGTEKRSLIGNLRECPVKAVFHYLDNLSICH